MTKITIQEVKLKTYKTAPYFFSAKTLKFWGQKLQNFKVKISPRGNIYIYAPSYNSDGVFRGVTFRQFVDEDLKIVLSFSVDVKDVLEYIKQN